jgi:hypothetical protein
MMKGMPSIRIPIATCPEQKLWGTVSLIPVAKIVRRSIISVPTYYTGTFHKLFFQYSFLLHKLVNRDDQHLLAHAIASDFTVTRQFSQR